MNELLPSPSRLLKAYATIAKGSLWLLLAFWLVLALAWGALHVWIVPRIGELRPDLEIEATRVLGVPVRIGAVRARTEGLMPSFELMDVVLLDPQGREALRLPRVVAAVSPRSLWSLGFEQLYIERPRVDVRRAADGRIFVAGLDFSRSSDNEGRAADWFFGQSEFVVLGGVVSWTDEMRAAPPLALKDVDLVVRNTGRRHALRLDATPPQAWGDRFTLDALLRQPLLSTRDGRWQDWIGELYADFSRVDVSELRRYANVGIEISHGHGAVRAWADLDRGQVVGGIADVALADVDTTLARDLPPLALQSVSGRLGGRRLTGGFEFKTENLQFLTLDGTRWPGGNAFVQWTQPEGTRLAHGEVRADRLDLEALGQIATRLPLGAATHRALLAYAPKGLVETVQGTWDGPLDAVTKYQARGRVARLVVAAQPAAEQRVSVTGAAAVGTPGVQGMSADFDVSQDGGKGKVAFKGGALDLPGIFEESLIGFDQLSADLQWHVEGDAISATIANLKFSNPDVQGEGKASWHTSDIARASTGSRFPGVLDLQASVSRAEGARVYRYLPLRVPKATREYVREAVTAGTAGGVKLRVKGDLRDFPFADAKLGEFHVSADVRDATYAFLPRSMGKGPTPWPALTQLSGELVFDRNSIQIKGANGKFTGAPGLQVRADAQIPNLRTVTVVVTGTVRGPLGEELAVVNGSPLSAMMGHALIKATGTGNADIRLQLALPLATIDKSRVQGSVTLAGNDVQITPESPVLSRARGVVTFSEHGFVLVGTQARALGGEVRVEGGAHPPPSGSLPGAEMVTLIRAQGTVTAEGLRQAREIGIVSRLARDVSGSTAYTVTLGSRRGVTEMQVTSTLQGLGLNLPPPLNKPPESTLPLRAENVLVGDVGARLQDQLSVELGRVASVSYLRDLSSGEPQVVRGSIAIGLASGESAQVIEQGVSANVSLASLNLDAWGDVLDHASGDAGGAASAPAQTSPLRPAPAAAHGYLPTVMALRAKQLTLSGRQLHNVVVGGSRDGLTWRANVDAQELNGYVEFRQPSNAGAGRLHARLARLSIAAAAAGDVESLLDEQPNSIPALDIVVDDFELRGKNLGRLEIDAVNRGAGAVAREGGLREWRLNKLSMVVPEATFSATGNWAATTAQAPLAAPPGTRPVGERRRTAMNFRIDVADAGQLLERFGMKDVIRRGKGRLEGQVAWVGSPLALDYPSMSGNFNTNVESGQFLKAEPGLGKLLGVLSLQSLPRRLTLDFRDVFTEGFAFDFVRGDVTIQQGIAATNNLQMKGVNAAVLMEGKADIAHETQDLKVVVVPEINAGTASLVATIINPAIGLGTFLAQMFLRQPLSQAATQEFHIDGTWADPRVTRVARTASAANSPAAPASEARPAGSD